IVARASSPIARVLLRHADPPHLHSFPTRRSSDLENVTSSISKPSSAAKSLTISKNSSCGPAVTPTFNDSSLSASELSFEFALLFSASPSPQAVNTKVAKINVVSNNNNFFKYIHTFLILVFFHYQAGLSAPSYSSIINSLTSSY